MPRRATAEPGLPPQAAVVLRQFRVVFNSVRRHFRQTERKAGVSGAHVWALSVVREHPAIGMGELAQIMDVHQSTASNLVRTLVAEEMVVVQRSTGDKRAVHLTLTAKGRKTLRSAPHPYAGVLPDVLAKMNPRALKRLQRDLGELIELLDPAQEGAQRPLGERRD